VVTPGIGPFVTDRSRQHNVDVVADTGVHNAAGQDLFLNRCGDSACLANCIDGAHVVFVATACEGRSGFIPIEVPKSARSTS
jgi:hypothetical protein